ncbi:MAG: hypothetical protein R3E01_22155 [Pirellulaceae bacterium]
MTHADQRIVQRIDELKEITPSNESTNAAIYKVRSVLEESEPTSAVSKKAAWSTGWRIIAGVAIAASLILAATLLPFGSSSLAFAEVQQQLSQLRNVTYNFVVGERSTKYIASGTFLRHEADQIVHILRPDVKKTLQLDHNQKQAVFFHDNRKQPSPPTDYVERLRTISADSVRELGKKVINGKSVIGFAVPETGSPNGMPMEVWVDPATRLPVKVIARGSRILEDFQFNVDLPADTFELNVPDGYFVENKYAEPQAPARLDGDELERYRAWAADPERTAEQSVEAFLKLYSAGESQLAKTLGINPPGDDLRKLDGFHDLRIESTYNHPGDTNRFLAVTNAVVSYRGQRAALVITTTRRDGRWLVEDVDLESEDDIEKEIHRFLNE